MNMKHRQIGVVWHKGKPIIEIQKKEEIKEQSKGYETKTTYLHGTHASIPLHSALRLLHLLLDSLWRGTD
jgi:hypothetical protein